MRRMPRRDRRNHDARISGYHRRTRSIAARVCSTVSGAIGRSVTITVHPSSPTSRCAGTSFTRRAFERIGPMPFDAERALARDTGLAAVVMRFLVVAMNPAYHPVRACGGRILVRSR